jgi:hypothetical protein
MQLPELKLRTEGDIRKRVLSEVKTRRVRLPDRTHGWVVE